MSNDSVSPREGVEASQGVYIRERQALAAFCVLVLAICYLATVAAILAWSGKYAEALGFGGITTGLVGVLGTFQPKTNSYVNTGRP